VGGGYGFSENAIADLDEICSYLGQRNVAVAGKFFDRVRQRCKLAAAFPGMGKAYEDLIPGMRGVVVDDYLVFYVAMTSGRSSTIAGGIQVLRVISGYRDLRSVFEMEE